MSEKTGLDLLRVPFQDNQISKLPKPTKKQTEDVKADFKKGIRCTICGGWHHPDVIHLDYVGHAALTDRLLDCDPQWTWEPLALNQHGYPSIDGDGGMWIKLTVCGVTRLGYGDAQGKLGGDAMKERIGDALRNAAMRFGAALDLWHKGGDLHGDGDSVTPQPTAKPMPEAVKAKAAAMKAKAQPKPQGHTIEGTSETITGDPNEGNVSGIGIDKPDSVTLDRIVGAFKSIAMDIPDIEEEYGKKIDEWTMEDVGYARDLFKSCKASRDAMMAEIAAERANNAPEGKVI